MKYVLKHRSTGLYFNGTNFSAKSSGSAKHFDTQPDMTVVSHVWAGPVVCEAIFPLTGWAFNR